MRWISITKFLQDIICNLYFAFSLIRFSRTVRGRWAHLFACLDIWQTINNVFEWCQYRVRAVFVKRSRSVLSCNYLQSDSRNARYSRIYIATAFSNYLFLFMYESHKTESSQTKHCNWHRLSLALRIPHLFKRLCDERWCEIVMREMKIISLETRIHTLWRRVVSRSPIDYTEREERFSSFAP